MFNWTIFFFTQLSTCHSISCFSFPLLQTFSFEIIIWTEILCGWKCLQTRVFIWKFKFQIFFAKYSEWYDEKQPKNIDSFYFRIDFFLFFVFPPFFPNLTGNISNISHLMIDWLLKDHKGNAFDVQSHRIWSLRDSIFWFFDLRQQKFTCKLVFWISTETSAFLTLLNLQKMWYTRKYENKVNQSIKYIFPKWSERWTTAKLSSIWRRRWNKEIHSLERSAPFSRLKYQKYRVSTFGHILRSIKDLLTLSWVFHAWEISFIDSPAQSFSLSPFFVEGIHTENSRKWILNRSQMNESSSAFRKLFLSSSHMRNSTRDWTLRKSRINYHIKFLNVLFTSQSFICLLDEIWKLLALNVICRDSRTREWWTVRIRSRFWRFPILTFVSFTSYISVVYLVFL